LNEAQLFDLAANFLRGPRDRAGAQSPGRTRKVAVMSTSTAEAARLRCLLDVRTCWRRNLPARVVRIGERSCRARLSSPALESFATCR